VVAKKRGSAPPTRASAGYLLDTHIFLWALREPERLSARMRALLEKPPAALYLSHVSVWEMISKASIGKLRFTTSLESVLERGLQLLGAQHLPLRYAHLKRLSVLPLLHRDPFDRALAAQCIEENLPLLSDDGIFKKYGAALY
jgi:PIN domain nuclease of toxin-antitoxin system